MILGDKNKISLLASNHLNRIIALHLYIRFDIYIFTISVDQHKQNWSYNKNTAPDDIAPKLQQTTTKKIHSLAQHTNKTNYFTSNNKTY